MITLMSIVCFLMGLFFLSAKNTTKNYVFLSNILIKGLGLFGTVLPIIYWIKKYNLWQM
jgi:hypothetical protein